MKRKVLVVDDEPDIARTIAMALELEGHEVSLAGSGQEALNKIKGGPPDLLILDMFLPEMNGKEIVRWIKSREEYKDIPIILITALAQKSEKEQFTGEQIDYCMIKPFDLGLLEQKVRELLRISQPGKNI
ncbi:MAG: response regulator [Candidatus Omnitrophica bacterium]|nr:response regulator [Candidatus Omnitrophota bacterium]